MAKSHRGAPYRVFWSDKEWDYCLRCLRKNVTVEAAMAELKERFPRRTFDAVRHKLASFNLTISSVLGVEAPKQKVEEHIKKVLEENSVVEKLKQDISRMNSEMSALRRQALTSEVLMNLIHGMKNVKFGGQPDWLTKPAPAAITGIPCLFLSDIHFDEYVSSDQVEGVNEYDHDIAVARLQHTFQTAVDLCCKYMNKPSYEGFVLALGGDLLSGNIHEELAETNEAAILESAISLADIIIAGIKLLKKIFGRVFVVCVVGNHGRLHRKPRAKNRVRDNFEWVVYQIVARSFKDDPSVKFNIPDSADAQFQIYNKSFLLTHGDQFKGGGGISGLMTPLMLGLHRKQKRQSSVHKPFDVMMMGHWHQYVHTDSMIINGSVKGYDEYAYLNNFPPEPPQQALFIVHPLLGITYRMPVRCDGYKLAKSNKPANGIW